MKFTVTNEQIGDGTAGPLQEWVVAWVAARYPELGVEYWSNNDRSDHGLKPHSTLPTRINHVGAYVHPGACEGQILKVVISDRDTGLSCLAWAKVFDAPDTLWAVARALSAALEEVCLFRTLPALAPEVSHTNENHLPQPSIAA